MYIWFESTARVGRAVLRRKVLTQQRPLAQRGKLCIEDLMKGNPASTSRFPDHAAQKSSKDVTNPGGRRFSPRFWKRSATLAIDVGHVIFQHLDHMQCVRGKRTFGFGFSSRAACRAWWHPRTTHGHSRPPFVLLPHNGPLSRHRLLFERYQSAEPQLSLSLTFFGVHISIQAVNRTPKWMHHRRRWLGLQPPKHLRQRICPRTSMMMRPAMTSGLRLLYRKGSLTRSTRPRLGS